MSIEVQLRFGSLASGEIAGTVVVTTGGQRSATGGAILLGNGHFGPAEFEITGQPGASYTIILPNSVMIEHDSSSTPISGVTQLEAVDLVSFSMTDGAVIATGLIDADGEDTVLVGATLVIPVGAKIETIAARLP